MGVLNEDKQQTDIGWVTSLVTRAHAEGLSPIEFGAFLKKRIITSGCNEQHYRAIACKFLMPGFNMKSC